jgi:hypothetical protein
MVVDDQHVVRVVASSREDDPPLDVDPNRMLAGPVALQRETRRVAKRD